MGYSTKQWKAINHYLTKNNLRPELSAFPMVRFSSKETGEVFEMHISNIEDFYIADRERAKREKAAASKLEKTKQRKGGS